MEILRKFLLASVALAVVGGGNWRCSDDDQVQVVPNEPEAVEITLSADAAVFGAAGGTKTVTVTAPSTVVWQAATDPTAAWCTIDKRGDVLEVSVGANESEEARVTAVTVSSPSDEFETLTLTVGQEGVSGHSFATNAADSYVIDSEGGHVGFVVLSDIDWNVELDAEAQTWLTVKADPAGTVTLTAAPNKGEARLKGSVTVSDSKGDEGHSKTIAVEQATRAENPYYKWLGTYEVKAPLWYHATSISSGRKEGPDDVTETHTTYYSPACQIVEGIYNESFVIENLLGMNQKLTVMYDKVNDRVAMTGNQITGYYNTYYPAYFRMTSVGNSGSLTTGAGTVLSLQAWGDLGEDGTISWSGFRIGDQQIGGGFGLFYMNDAGNFYFFQYTFFPFALAEDDPSTPEDDTVIRMVPVAAE